MATMTDEERAIAQALAAQLYEGDDVQGPGGLFAVRCLTPADNRPATHFTCFLTTPARAAEPQYEVTVTVRRIR